MSLEKEGALGVFGKLKKNYSLLEHAQKFSISDIIII
nr:MAG TPA: hypothetical protein [Caudoviricetes sp.]